MAPTIIRRERIPCDRADLRDRRHIIALALFLIPIAYLYTGRTEGEVFWVGSGIVLLLVLNLVRMASHILRRLTYGPSQTALLAHTFLGVILFYAAIVLMILIRSATGWR